MANYEVWLLTDRGDRLSLLEYVTAVEYVRVINAPNRFVITVPASRLDVFVDTPDYRVEIWRGAGEARAKRLELAGLVRKIGYKTSDGKTTITLSGPDFTELLNRRIVAYRAEQAQSQKSGPADDLMKAIVRENLGSSSGTDYAGNPVTGRDLSDLGFSVQQDLGLGPSLDKALAWRNVLMALREIAEASMVAGTPVYFDVVPLTDNLQFQTFTGQPGLDRTAGTGSPVILGLEYGNLDDPSLTLDFEAEVTHVYAGGKGDSAANTRILIDIGDATRKNQSVWNRREAFLDTKMDTSTAEVTSSARARLEAGRPRRIFSGMALDVPGNRYMKHWDLGDKVTVNYLGQTFDVLITSVRVELSESGAETIRGRLRLL